MKICDFDLAREWEEQEPKSMTFCGTYRYMAPEIFRDSKGCFKVSLMFKCLC